MRFRPPSDKPFIIKLAKLCTPIVRRLRCGGLDVELTPNARAVLAATSGPAILSPNHPTHDDPIVMFEVSKQLSRRFNYVAAYEVFEEAGPLTSWLFRAVGCYSIVRGTVDRESFRTTRRLLAEEQRTIVIFIEGTAPYQNDSLLPFQAGVVQLGFWAIEDAHKAGKPPAALSVVPICIKYVFDGDPRHGIESLLADLERQVLGNKTVAGTLLERVRALGEGILRTLEENLAVTAPASSTVGERVEHLKGVLLERAENFAGVVTRAGTAYTDRIFAARRAADSALLGVIEGASAYQKRLFEERRSRLAFLYRDIDRLTLFANFYDSYLSEYPSYERIADVLDRLHREVYAGKRASLPHRTAVVDVAEPIDLVARLEDYHASKKTLVNDLTQTLQDRTQTLLETLYRARTKPIPLTHNDHD